jgi:hypothetical protein
MADFCKSNYLMLNSSKTAVMLYRNPRSSYSMYSPYINISGKSEKCVQSTKLLGLHLMENLSWSDHANFVVGKLSSTVFMVNSLRATVDCR